MSIIENENGSQGESGVQDNAELVVEREAEPRQRGVRIVELGRKPQEVSLPPGVTIPISEFINQNGIELQPTQELYINMRRVTDPTAVVTNGDNVLVTQKWTAGGFLRRS
jgi:hypothetical protein